MVFDGSLLERIALNAGLLFILTLGAVWVLGCLRALRYLARWYRAQSRSTRWLMFLFPLSPFPITFVSSYYGSSSDTLTILALFLSLFSGFLMGFALITAGLLHSIPTVHDLRGWFRRRPLWQRTLLITVPLDIISAWLLRG
jgi:hypothetical protein